MNLKILQLKLENFKGIKDKTIKFDGQDVVIKGANGQGKTTIADSFYFLFAGCNTALVKNPAITPLGAEECVSRVEANVEIDGKPCTVAKSQKFKRKIDDDGKVTSSTTNSYEINTVEKSERDFIADLTQRGLDMDRFLIFSNPEQFMSDTSKKGRETLRTVLFEMAESVSDLDVAKDLKTSEAKTLLEQGYSLDEIESMNKATIRKIVETSGKNNELIDARIQGILDSKAQANAEDIKKVKAEYEAELKAVKESIGQLSKGDNEIKGKIAELEGKLINIERTERLAIEEKTAKAEDKLRKAEHERNNLEIDMTNTKNSMDKIYADMDGVKESLENYRNLYKKVQDEVFDEGSTKCPTCGREYEADRISEIKRDFENGKTKRLKDYKAKGETFSKQLELQKKDYDAESAIYAKQQKSWKAADAKVNKLRNELKDIPRNPDMSQNKDYIDTKEQIEKLRSDLQSKGDLKLQEYSNRESYLLQMIRQADGELAVIERNKELDEQVEILRQEKKQSEINKAKAEKIVDQVNKIKRAKNERLGESINSHFKIVDFKLWDLRKNGEYVDTIDLMIDGKPASICANGSLLQLAKLDCLAGLQNYFNQHVPVFCEDAALLTDNTRKRIDIDSQLIQLVATDSVKELRIEKGVK